MNFRDMVALHPVLKGIMETIMDGVIVVEEAGRCIYVNEGAEKIFGLSREALTSRHFDAVKSALLSEDGIPLTGDDTPFSRVLQEDEMIPAEKVFVHRPDGSRLPVLLNVSPVVLEGVKRGVVGVITDISPLEHIEELRRDYQESISHDLRTPLTVILGHAEALKIILGGFDLPPEIETSIQSIHRAGKRMLNMLNDLLEVARLEAHPVQLEREPVHLDNYLPTMLRDFYNPAAYERLEFRMPPESPVANADAEQLGRVVTNLVNNALKYSEDGSPIVIETAASAGFVRISVHDRGQGIAPERIPAIFERFDRNNERGGGGFGLGLFIVRLLTETHGGHFFACSHPGEGSTFSVYFPESHEHG